MEEVKKPARGSSLLNITATAALALAVSTGLLWKKVNTLESEVQASPAVVVVDFMQIAQKYPVGAPEAEIERQMMQVGHAIKRLGEAGYIVLDSSNVLSAPDSALLHDLYELAVQGGEGATK